MSPTTINAAEKEAVKKALVARTQAAVDVDESGVQSHEAAASVDQDSSYAVDDLAQSDAAGDLTGLFERNAAAQEATADAVEALDVSPTEVVRAGAIVGFGGNRYLVGVVADPFEVEGQTYEGISLDSPIYAEIEGLRTGDTFTFAGTQQTLDVVA